jgi:RNA polymerase sigma-70 factor (ECF subfamily)
VTPEVTPAVADAFREEWGQIVATLIGLTGDWDLAEDCAQDAFAVALERWPRDGVPRRPGAWLTTTARHRATDRLRLMFTCCHPALALESRVALTLRTLAGLSTAEIARAFLVPEPTMSKRLVRAKQKIGHAGIPYRVPPAHLLPERTNAAA